MTIGRIIPAYAGSTESLIVEPSAIEDHPRLRGEHWARGVFRGDRNGSSPLTRGALPAVAAPLFQTGIIPAYAGSTFCHAESECLGKDHPRLRGEHRCTSSLTSTTRGSSPLTRGARYTFEVGLERIGIIPAYAGSTVRLSKRKLILRDHPRLRGEHSTRAFL